MTKSGPFTCKKCNKPTSWPTKEYMREAYRKNKRPDWFCSCPGFFESKREEWLMWRGTALKTVGIK